MAASALCRLGFVLLNQQAAPKMSALSMQRLTETIDSSERCWLVFCQSSSLFSYRALEIESEQMNDEEKSLIFQMKILIEDIRKIFSKALKERRDFTIVPIKDGSCCLIREKSDGITLIASQQEIQLNAQMSVYKNYVEPWLKNFFQTLGTPSYFCEVVQALEDKGPLRSRCIRAIHVCIPDFPSPEMQ